MSKPHEVHGIVSSYLNPDVSSEKEEAISRTLGRYAEPRRKWHNLGYLALGLREHRRLLGRWPGRDTMSAWLYHAYELGDEEASAVEFLRDAGALGFSLDEAERFIAPLIVGSRPSLQSSSVLGDMRLAILGQPRISYLSYSRKLRKEYPFLDSPAWCLGRAAVLKEMLAREPIYFRGEFESSMAARAKANMKAELDLLL